MRLRHFRDRSLPSISRWIKCMSRRRRRLYPESATSNNQKKYRIPLANIREEELPAEALAKGAGSSMTEQDSFCAFNTTIRFETYLKRNCFSVNAPGH
jgi:hypothetical protein